MANSRLDQLGKGRRGDPDSEKIASNAWLVVWAIAEETPQPDGAEFVSLAGWTPTSEIVRQGFARWTAGVHANVHVSTNLVRNMSELIDLAAARVEFPSLQRRDPECGHPNVLGHLNRTGSDGGSGHLISTRACRPAG